MKPITIQIEGVVPLAPPEICAGILDTERWSEFQGYGILPGIRHAHMETKTPGVLGSRIRVHNTDGSSHVEEIVEWDVNRRIALRFQEFDSPVQHFATHFLEAWEFRPAAGGTRVTRRMTMFPRGLFGWLMLLPISRLMKKAFEAQALVPNAPQHSTEKAA